MFININGEITTKEKAKISIFDRGFLFGDSVYEVISTYNHVLFKLDEHVQRLWESASRLAIPISLSKKELVYEIEKTLKKLQVPEAYIRVIITRGEGMIGLDPALATKNNIIIICKKLPPNPSWWYQSGVEVIVAKILRNPKESVDPNIKSGNYLNNVLAYAEAKDRGAFDAIMLNRDGLITEGTTNNIWIVKNKIMLTPPLEAGILSGITRETLIKLAKENGLDVQETNFYPEQLYQADECFLTSSTKELVPIIKVDEKSIGSGSPGPMTKKLHLLYKEYINKHVEAMRKKMANNFFSSCKD